MISYAQSGMRRPVGTLGEVLCIDDDPVVQVMLDEIVRTAGGQYQSARSAQEAKERLEETRFDLILLDRRLPDSDGLLLLQIVKEQSDCPVIVLSALNGTHDKILGLGLGAAEYITKPFNPAELSSRIHSLLTKRHKIHNADMTQPLSCGDLWLHPDTRCLRINETETFIPPAEARLLYSFLQNLGQALSRDALTRSACGREWTPGDRTVDVLVARLRQRIPANVAQIITVHRYGYVLKYVSSC